MSDVPALGEPRAFEFLLNAMERAAHEDTPADHGYAEKRRAVFEYVAQLVALATGGAEGGLQQEHSGKTGNGQLESSSARDATMCADCGMRADYVWHRLPVGCSHPFRAALTLSAPPMRIETIQRVQQEDPKGCAVACLAMVSGRTYAEVRWTVNAAQVERGLADQTVVWWLNRYGLWHRRWWMDGEWGRPAPTSGVAIMLTHDAHWVVLVDGVVLDPARPEPLASYDFRQAIEVRPERVSVLAVDPSWSSPTACAVSTYTVATPEPRAR